MERKIFIGDTIVFSRTACKVFSVDVQGIAPGFRLMTPRWFVVIEVDSKVESGPRFLFLIRWVSQIFKQSKTLDQK